MTFANTTGPPGSAASRDATRAAVGVIRRLLQRPELASLGGLAAAFIVFSILRPDLFLTHDNGVNVAGLASQYGIVAVGVTVLMIAGHFDLSVGTIVGLTGWAMYYFGNVLGLPPILTILCTLAVGTLLGALNGVIQVRTGLPSFIITLATSLVYRGVLTMNTSGFPVVVKFPASYAHLIAGKLLFGYRMSVLWFLVVAALATLFLLRTRMGNWTFAIGQNATAARNLGVPVARATVTLFALSGFTSGVAGIVVAVQYFSIDANRGVGWELIAIAMTVIGGTLLTGGYGSVLGTVLGAFMYAMVNAGLLLVGLQGYWVNIFLGIVVLIAVLINRVVIDRFVMSPERAALEQPIILADEGRPVDETDWLDAVAGADRPPPGGGVAEPVVALRDVTMSFQSVTALRNISIEADVGKVLALLGDNGAGKSTLIKVLSGVYQPTSGSVEVDGRPVRLRSAHDARAAGISTVFQDLAVCDLMSIARNMVLGNEPVKRFGPLRIYDPKKANRITADALARLGVDLRRRLSDPAATLSGGQKQAVAIARAIVYGSRCLILDEPTAALAVRQTQQVLDQVRRARHAGQAVILIMHNLQQAISVADEVVVLARGRVMGQFSSRSLSWSRMADRRKGPPHGCGGRFYRERASLVSDSEHQTAPNAAARRFDLRGRVVVVTGASKGIGRELSILLAETGAVVVPTVLRTEADAAAVVSEAQSRRLTVHPQRLDVRDVATIAKAVSRIVAAHGHIDVLVNNAGLGFARAAFKVTEADWDEMMPVNLRGAFFMSQAVAHAMAASGRGGRIVNVSSQGGLVGLPDAAVYCASKGGLNMMTKALALEWAKDAITVNAIAPTFIYTPGTAPILDDPEMQAAVLGKIPLGQFALTNDVAGAVIYLASDAGRMVTGTILVGDGGRTSQ